MIEVDPDTLTQALVLMSIVWLPIIKEFGIKAE